MRWLLTRRQHDRALTAVQFARLADAINLVRDTTVRERSAAVDTLIRRADGLDLDADHADGRRPADRRTTQTLTPNNRRVLADELRTIARDLASTP